jgi:hypothetical protein
VIHVVKTDESRMAVKGCGSPDMDDERNQR